MTTSYNETVSLTDAIHRNLVLLGSPDNITFVGGYFDVVTTEGAWQQVNLAGASNITVIDHTSENFCLNTCWATGSKNITLEDAGFSASWSIGLDDSSMRQGMPATFVATRGGTMITTPGASGDTIFVMGESVAVTKAHTLG